MNTVVKEWIAKADIRYPGEMALPEDAEQAIKALRTVRALVREKLDPRQ